MNQILSSASSPGKDPSALWSVQLQLLRLAEDTLGPRDASKTIYASQSLHTMTQIFGTHRTLMEHSPN